MDVASVPTDVSCSEGTGFESYHRELVVNNTFLGAGDSAQSFPDTLEQCVIKSHNFFLLHSS